MPIHACNVSLSVFLSFVPRLSWDCAFERNRKRNCSRQIEEKGPCKSGGKRAKRYGKIEKNWRAVEAAAVAEGNKLSWRTEPRPAIDWVNDQKLFLINTCEENFQRPHGAEKAWVLSWRSLLNWPTKTVKIRVFPLSAGPKKARAKYRKFLFDMGLN